MKIGLFGSSREAQRAVIEGLSDIAYTVYHYGRDYIHTDVVYRQNIAPPAVLAIRNALRGSSPVAEESVRTGLMCLRRIGTSHHKGQSNDIDHIAAEFANQLGVELAKQLKNITA